MKTNLTLLLLMFSSLLMAQNQVEGYLTDAEGQPLPWVRVEIKNGKTAVYSDESGYYQLPAGSGDTLLVYSGVRPFTVVLGDDGRLDLTLEETVATRREVYSLGYDRRPQFSLTHPVTRLDRPDFNDGNIYDPLQLVQGRAPGLAASRPGGNPLESYDFFLRGVHTLVGNAAPLVVVDGLPAASLLTLDPHDIESVTFLRSAAGAAAYGARGANGVVLIESRRGQAGKLRLNFRSYLAVDGFANPIEVLSGDEYRRLRNDQSFPFANQLEDFGETTDWVDEISRMPLSQAHHLGLSSGFGKTTYRASFNYRTANGLIRESGFAQYGGGLRLDQRLWQDRIKLSADVWLTDRQGEEMLSDIYRNALNMNPTAPVRSDAFPEFGGYFQPFVFDLYNPVAAIEQTVWDRDQQQWLVNLQGSFSIARGLQLEGRYSRQRQDRLNGYHNTTDSFLWEFFDGIASREAYESTNQLGEVLLRYRTNFGNHHLSLTGGHSYQQIEERSDLVWAREFTAGNVTYQDLENPDFNGAAFIQRGGLGITRKFSAFFLQGHLDLNGFVFLSGSLRREGSSRFGENNRWGMFPAASAGLDLARVLGGDGLGQLKLRAGYGVVGNPPPDGIYQDRRFGPTVEFFYNGEFIEAFGPYNSPNADLRWEERREFNAGVDFSFWKDRLRGSLDYYASRSEDLVIDYFVPVPPNVSGSLTDNVAQMTNRGIELALGADLVRREGFHWSLDLNLSTYRNEVESLPFLENERIFFEFFGPGFGTGLGSRLAEGEPVSHLYLPLFQRFNNTDGWVLRDLDGDPNNFDPVVVGQAWPKWTLGLGSRLQWGRFDLNFLWRGAFGHSLFYLDDLFYGWPSQTGYNYRPQAIEGNRRTFTSFPRQSDFFVKKGNFLRLNNLVIGYRLPLESLRRFRIFIGGNNLLTFTSYPGMDPEVRYSNSPNFDPAPEFRELGTEVARGSLRSPQLMGGNDDPRTYPLNRSVVLGVEIKI